MWVVGAARWGAVVCRRPDGSREGWVTMRRLFLTELHEDEAGHLLLGLPNIVASAGAGLLAGGAAGGEDVVTIIGGVALAVGLLWSGVAQHNLVDYDVWRRLDRLERLAEKWLGER